MRILVVYCHPKDQKESFTGAVLDKFLAGAQAAGHDCEVADLYREGFDPVMSERDLQQFDGVAMPEDVLCEQQRIERADGLCFIFPIWWYGMPAMLKGWLDRVWSSGWAYDWVEQMSGSVLAERPCTFLMPIGSNKKRLETWSYHQHLDNLWRNGVLDFCALTPLSTHFLADTDGFNEEPFPRHLELAFNAGRDFGSQKGEMTIN